MVALKKTTEIQVQTNNYPMESLAQVCNLFDSPGLNAAIEALMPSAEINDVLAVVGGRPEPFIFCAIK